MAEYLAENIFLRQLSRRYADGLLTFEEYRQARRKIIEVVEASATRLADAPPEPVVPPETVPEPVAALEKAVSVPDAPLSSADSSGSSDNGSSDNGSSDNGSNKGQFNKVTEFWTAPPPPMTVVEDELTPIAAEPVVKEPVITGPVVDAPVVNEPVVNEPVIVDEPTADGLVEAPVTDKPAVDGPMVDEPAAEELAEEEPAAVVWNAFTCVLFVLATGAFLVAAWALIYVVAL